MRIGILGAGALGSLLAAYLTRSQAAGAVWLLARSPRPGTVTVDDWTVPVTVMGRPTEPVDLLIVLVKAYATRAALDWAAGAIGPGTVLLTLQNGLGNAEVLAETVGPGRVLAGTTALGARLVEPGRVRLGGVGETMIAPWGGPLSPAARLVPHLVALLTQAGLPTRGAPAAEPLLWAKLAVNAAINPLSALLRVPNGQLLELPLARTLLAIAAAEVGAVAQAAGIALAEDPVARALQVAGATAANRSSMLQDVEAGRPTEIEAISGEVVRRAEALGVAVPVNRTLLALVRTRAGTTERFESSPL